MAALNAVIGVSGAGGYRNVCVTIDLSQRTLMGWPPPLHDLGNCGATATVAHPPVTAAGRVISGARGRGYVDDFYDRVWVTPSLIELGNLLQTQTRFVEVWNAWRDRGLTLTAVDEVGAEGMTITGEGALPLAFSPLQQRQWTLAISTDGPAGIDATLTWLFAEGDTGHVEITGQRLTAWFVMPDWTNGVTETLTWLTEVTQGWTGSQDRTPLRAAPRRAWEFDIALAGQDRQRAEALLFAWRGRAWALPIWADQELTTGAIAAGAQTVPFPTANLDYVVGGTALLYGSAAMFELVEVAEIAADGITLARPTVNGWPARTRVYPCRPSRLDATPKLTRKSSDVLTTTVKFDQADESDWPAAAPAATYRGYPVLEERIDESEDPTAQFDRVLDVQDNDTGLPDTADRTNLGWATQSQAWTLYGRAQRAAHRSLLYWLQGRVQAVWLPTWSDDFTLQDLVAANATILRTLATGAALYLAATPGRRHIRIELYDGTIYYREITAATDLGDGTEQLAIDAPFNVQIDPAQIRQISWLQLMTSAADSFEIHHVTDSIGLATCTANFVGVPAEEPA